MSDETFAFLLKTIILATAIGGACVVVAGLAFGTRALASYIRLGYVPAVDVKREPQWLLASFILPLALSGLSGIVDIVVVLIMSVMLVINS